MGQTGAGTNPLLTTHHSSLTRSSEPTFACDAMLGGLARWLRAAGADAWWRADVDDWELIRLARREGRVLLTCDTGIVKIGVVRDGRLPALLVPHGLKKREQFAFVAEHFQLRPRQPRCMACGGVLAEVRKEEVRDQIPPRSYAWLDRFFRCGGCGQMFWEGTHWRKIADFLEQVERAAPSPRPPDAV